MDINGSYIICVKGHLDDRWLSWFEGLQVERPEGMTVLSGSLDQAALHGVLSRIRDLGLVLISVQCDPPLTIAQREDGPPAT